MWKRILKILLFLALVDIVIWFVVFHESEPPLTDMWGRGMMKVLLNFTLSGASLLAGVWMLWSRRAMGIALMINSLVCFFIIGAGMKFDHCRHGRMLYQKWEFSTGGSDYQITRYIHMLDPGKDYEGVYYLPHNHFEVSKLRPDGSMGVTFGGTTYEGGDTVFFKVNDSILFYIAGNVICGFEGIPRIEASR